MPDVVIRDLVDFPECLPTISAWFHGEWSDLLGTDTPADIEHHISHWTARDAIPTALVAVIEHRVVGTVLLKGKAFDHYGEAPWLSGLYVVPEHRQAGIGLQLVRAAEKKAASMGIHKLYLYTPRAQRFYETLGWRRKEERAIASICVTVMEKTLFPQNMFQPLPAPGRG